MSQDQRDRFKYSLRVRFSLLKFHLFQICSIFTSVTLELASAFPLGIFPFFSRVNLWRLDFSVEWSMVWTLDVKFQACFSFTSPRVRPEMCHKLWHMKLLWIMWIILIHIFRFSRFGSLILIFSI